MNKEKTVNSGNMIRAAAAATLCLLGMATVRAQGATPAGAATGGKIGVLNVRQAIVTTAEGKQASAELQSQFAPRQNEMEALNKQINDIRQQLAANQTTWSDEQKTKAQTQGQRLAAQLERKNNELQTDVNDAQGEEVDRIARKMLEVLDRYSRQNRFVPVIEPLPPPSPILLPLPNI